MEHQAISLACATLAKTHVASPFPGSGDLGWLAEVVHVWRRRDRLRARGSRGSKLVGESRATLKHRLLLLLPLLRFAFRLSSETFMSDVDVVAVCCFLLTTPNRSLSRPWTFLTPLRLSFLSPRRLDCWLVTDPAQRSCLSSRRYIGSKLNTCRRRQTISSKTRLAPEPSFPYSLSATVTGSDNCLMVF
jgi:hypothetical protein